MAFDPHKGLKFANLIDDHINQVRDNAGHPKDVATVRDVVVSWTFSRLDKITQDTSSDSVLISLVTRVAGLVPLNASFQDWWTAIAGESGDSAYCEPVAASE